MLPSSMEFFELGSHLLDIYSEAQNMAVNKRAKDPVP